MNEEFLHFIWKYRLYDPQSLRNGNGDLVEVLRPGDPNTDAGPDFLNCRIRVNNTVWAGNAEIHLRSSDWNRHRHQHDKSYDNVVLHLVQLHDVEVLNSSGREVSTCILRCDEQLMQNYHALRNNQSWAPCEEKLKSLDPFLVRQWLARMMVERLEKRSGSIKQLLEEAGGDWQEVFYRMTLLALGMKVNSSPFEILGRMLPYKLLLKHRDNQLQLEALLFGQSGFLAKELFEDEYFTKLRLEYEFLQKKYSLRPMDVHQWKFMRLRPGNFPTIRIAQAAALIRSGIMDFSYLVTCNTTQLAGSVTGLAASEYWETHFQFHKESKKSLKKIGTEAASIILINAMIPVLFAWGSDRKKQEVVDYALAQLEQIPAEDNTIIRHWAERGLEARHAFNCERSSLRNNYCVPRYCLQCAIGTKIVTRSPDVKLKIET
ncbi:MAG: DUF2851 family protein [Bacteroidales bacterium]